MDRGLDGYADFPQRHPAMFVVSETNSWTHITYPHTHQPLPFPEAGSLPLINTSFLIFQKGNKSSLIQWTTGVYLWPPPSPLSPGEEENIREIYWDPEKEKGWGPVFGKMMISPDRREEKRKTKFWEKMMSAIGGMLRLTNVETWGVGDVCLRL